MTKVQFLYTQRPSFLAKTFHWKERGYHYAHPPDVDLVSSEALSSPDPWIVVAAVLERAKRGDFRGVSRLEKWAVMDDAAPTLVGACLDLIANAGGEKALEWLATEMLDRTGFAQVELVRAAQWSGQLQLVPFMVEARKLQLRHADRDSIEACVSNMLDRREGEPELYGRMHSNEEYETLVLSKVQALVDQHGTDRLAVLEGEPVDVWKMVADMQEQLTRRRESGEWLDWGNFLLWRRTFETYTGVDCSRFYDDKGSFMPLNAAAALEKYAAREPRIDFSAGQRYFFGHPVPY